MLCDIIHSFYLYLSQVYCPATVVKTHPIIQIDYTVRDLESLLQRSLRAPHNIYVNSLKPSTYS